MAKLPVINHTDHSLGTISLKPQTSSISGLKESYCSVRQSGLDFHQILYRQILRVKGRVAFQWVVFTATISEYLSDKKDSKTI